MPFQNKNSTKSSPRNTPSNTTPSQNPVSTKTPESCAVVDPAMFGELCAMHKQLMASHTQILQQHELILAQQAQILNRLVTLETKLAEVIETVRSDSSDGSSGTASVVKSLPLPAAPQPLSAGSQQSLTISDVHKVVVQALSGQQQLQEKSLRAVVEHLPEQADEDTTRTSDREQIESVADAAGVGDSLISDTIHRHGVSKAGRSRPIKVSFSSVPARDKFIRFFAKNRTEYMKDLQRSVTCRRDLMPFELETHYRLKKECYDLNKQAGEFRYYYRDLRIYECNPPYAPLRSTTSQTHTQPKTS